MTDLFVYGTLKRGCRNHAWLAGQTYVGPARTVPGYRLFLLAGYPGMVPWPDDRSGVTGEIWRVDAATLAQLDRFEGVDEGLYRREGVLIETPNGPVATYAYLYAQSVAGRTDLGSTWTEWRRVKGED